MLQKGVVDDAQIIFSHVVQAAGRNVTFSDAISNSSSITALIWSASAGIVVAIAVLAIQKIAGVNVSNAPWFLFAVQLTGFRAPMLIPTEDHYPATLDSAHSLERWSDGSVR